MIAAYQGDREKGEIEIIDTKIIYNDNYYALLLDHVVFPNQTKAKYPRLQNTYGGGVVILPVDPAGKIHLVEEFRHGARNWSLELPRGFLKKGESVEAAAQRELMEELGAVCTRLEYLGSVYPDPGFSNNEVFLYKADGIKIVRQETPDREPIRNRIALTIDKVKKLIADNTIVDSFTICAFTRGILLQG